MFQGGQLPQFFLKKINFFLRGLAWNKFRRNENFPGFDGIGKVWISWVLLFGEAEFLTYDIVAERRSLVFKADSESELAGWVWLSLVLKR